MEILSTSTDNGELAITYIFNGQLMFWNLGYIPRDYIGTETDWDKFFVEHDTDGYSIS